MRENLTKGPGSPGASGPWKQGPWKQVLVTEEPEPLGEVFRWLASSEALVDEVGGVEGGVVRNSEVLRINPATLAMEEVAADLPVFESPFNLEPAFLRICRAYTNALPGLGADTEGVGLGWSQFNATLSENTFSAPWADHFGDGIIPSAGMNQHSSAHFLNALATAPGRRVFVSGVVAAGASPYLAVGCGVMTTEDDPGTQFSVPYILVNTSSGEIADSGDFFGAGAEPTNQFIIPLAGGSYFVGFEFIVPAGGAWVYIQAVPADASGNPAFAGDGVTVYSNFWGFTLRQQGGWQPFTNQATERAADAVSWPMPAAVASALGSWGTLVFEFSPTVAAADGPAACNLVSCNGTAQGLLYFDGTNLASTDGTATATASLAFTQGGRYLACVQWDDEVGLFRVGTRVAGQDWAFGDFAPFGGFPVGSSLHIGFDPSWGLYAGRVVFRDDNSGLAEYSIPSTPR